MSYVTGIEQRARDVTSGSGKLGAILRSSAGGYRGDWQIRDRITNFTFVRTWGQVFRGCWSRAIYCPWVGVWGEVRCRSEFRQVVGLQNSAGQDVWYGNIEHCPCSWNSSLKGSLRGRVHLQKLIVMQLLNRISAYYGNWKFITVFTTVNYLAIFWAT